MERLSKNDLDYLVRTIMPELYEQKAKKDTFMEQLMETLPDAPLRMISIAEPYAAEKRLTA